MTRLRKDGYRLALLLGSITNTGYQPILELFNHFKDYYQFTSVTEENINKLKISGIGTRASQKIVEVMKIAQGVF